MTLEPPSDRNDPASLEETLEVLSDPCAMQEIAEARADLAAGRTLSAGEIIARYGHRPRGERGLQTPRDWPLVREPRRAGAPRPYELRGVWSARRGPYRVLNEIDEERLEVRVLNVGHRADVYRQPS